MEPHLDRRRRRRSDGVRTREEALRAVLRPEEQEGRAHILHQEIERVEVEGVEALRIPLDLVMEAVCKQMKEKERSIERESQKWRRSIAHRVKRRARRGVARVTYEVARTEGRLCA